MIAVRHMLRVLPALWCAIALPVHFVVECVCCSGHMEDIVWTAPVTAAMCCAAETAEAAASVAHEHGCASIDEMCLEHAHSCESPDQSDHTHSDDEQLVSPARLLLTQAATVPHRTVGDVLRESTVSTIGYVADARDVCLVSSNALRAPPAS